MLFYAPKPPGPAPNIVLPSSLCASTRLSLMSACCAVASSPYAAIAMLERRLSSDDAQSDVLLLNNACTVLVPSQPSKTPLSDLLRWSVRRPKRPDWQSAVTQSMLVNISACTLQDHSSSASMQLM